MMEFIFSQKLVGCTYLNCNNFKGAFIRERSIPNSHIQAGRSLDRAFIRSFMVVIQWA